MAKKKRKPKVRVKYWQMKTGTKRGEWRWGAYGGNNKFLCGPGESFDRKAGMMHNLNLIFNQLDHVPFEEVDKNPRT